MRLHAEPFCNQSEGRSIDLKYTYSLFGGINNAGLWCLKGQLEITFSLKLVLELFKRGSKSRSLAYDAKTNF